METPKYAFSRKKVLVYSLLPALLLFASLEGVARLAEVWFPLRPADIGLGFTEDSQLFVPSPAAPDSLITNPQKLLSFVDQRFPARKSPKTVRIFMLGGSSVYYLGQDLTLASKRLAAGRWQGHSLETINAGGLGYGSHRLVPITAEILGYEPDLVLIYSGHNEFQELELLHLAGLETVWLQRLLARSAFCRLIQDRLASRKISKLEAEHNRRVLENANPTFVPGPSWREQFCGYTAEQIAERMKAYRANLACIIEMCRARGVPVVVGTVPSNLLQPELCEKDAGPYREVRELYQDRKYTEVATRARHILASTVHNQATDLENNILRGLAKRYSVPLADIEASVIAAEPHQIPGETLFDDHCHLNHKGNKILARTFENTIIEWLQGAE